MRTWRRPKARVARRVARRQIEQRASRGSATVAYPLRFAKLGTGVNSSNLLSSARIVVLMTMPPTTAPS
jgi:hypothetical protein